jgi:hypothetical protein
MSDCVLVHRDEETEEVSLANQMSDFVLVNEENEEESLLEETDEHYTVQATTKSLVGYN